MEFRHCGTRHIRTARRDGDARKCHGYFKNSIAVINPSRRKLQDTLDEYQKQNIEKNIFLHSNDYYAGWDSVHLRQQITHTHMSLKLFKQTLERSTFTVIPCSINTIDHFAIDH